MLPRFNLKSGRLEFVTSINVSMLLLCEYTLEKTLFPYQFSKSELSELFSVKNISFTKVKIHFF
jgi:hypothetical protein